MAKSKKKSKKIAKKTAKKKAARRAQPPRLTAEQRSRALKPGEDLDELGLEAVTAWERVKKLVHVPGESPKKLRSMIAKVQKLVEKEREKDAAHEERMASLRDARIAAGDAAYRLLLDLKPVAEAVARRKPEVADAFATFFEKFARRFTSKGGNGGSDEPAPPPDEPA